MYTTRRSRGDRRAAHVQRAAAVDGEVARRVGSGRRGRSSSERTLVSCTFARCDPATTPSSPLSESAPVTEMPTVKPQHRREWPPIAVLVPRDVGDALDDADLLPEPLGTLTVAADVAPASSVSCRSFAIRSLRRSSCNVGDSRLKPRIRDGYQPSSVPPTRRRRRRCVGCGDRASSSAETAAISGSAKTPRGGGSRLRTGSGRSPRPGRPLGTTPAGRAANRRAS